MNFPRLFFILCLTWACTTFAQNSKAILIKESCKLPEYPSASKRNEEEGAVQLKFLVEVGGKVIDSVIEKSSGFKRLDEAARASLSKCLFKPANIDGKFDQSWVSMQYVFSLGPSRPCNGEDVAKWDRCLGSLANSLGGMSVIEYVQGKQNGNGIEYNKSGKVTRSGVYENGKIIIDRKLNTKDYPFNSKFISNPSDAPISIALAQEFHLQDKGEMGDFVLSVFFPSNFKPMPIAIQKAESEITEEKKRLEKVGSLTEFAYQNACPSGELMKDRDRCFGTHKVGQVDSKAKYTGNYQDGSTSNWGLTMDSSGFLNLSLLEDRYDFGLRFRIKKETDQMSFSSLKEGQIEGFTFSQGQTDDDGAYVRFGKIEQGSPGSTGYGVNIDRRTNYIGQYKRGRAEGIGINYYKDNGNKFIGYRKNDKAFGKNTLLRPNGSRSINEYDEKGISYTVDYNPDGALVRAGTMIDGKFNADKSRLNEFPFDFHVSIENEIQNEIWVLNQRRKFTAKEYAKTIDALSSRASQILASFEKSADLAKQTLASRKALIIGNNNYTNVTKLLNAREDAKSIATILTGFGYKVTLRLDVNEKEIKTALRNFASQVQAGDEVMFFFAGHGIQLGATNYLLPTDIGGESEAQIKDEAIQLQRILDDMSEKKAKFTLAMIDACRDNPFKGQGRNIGSRGLAPTTAATGQMVVFSAGSGQQALDRLGEKDKSKNGVFTRTFLKEMQKPGQSVDRIIRNVRNEVADLAKSIGHEQVPAIYDQVIGDFYFKK